MKLGAAEACVDVAEDSLGNQGVYSDVDGSLCNRGGEAEDQDYDEDR